MEQAITFVVILGGTMLAVFVAMLLGALHHRWLIWTLICRRGRRCARIHYSGEIRTAPPAGSVAAVDYDCGACGTRYRTTVLFGADGAYTEAERVRL